MLEATLIATDSAPAANSPDPRILARVAGARLVFLALAAACASASILVAAVPALGSAMPAWLPMSFHSAMAALAGAVGLAVAPPAEVRNRRTAAFLVAAFASLSMLLNSGAILVPAHPTFKSILTAELYPGQGGLTDVPIALVIGALALLLPLLYLRHKAARILADVLVCIAAFDTLTIAGRHAFALAHLFPANPTPTPELSVLVLCLLTAVAAAHQAHSGALRVFFLGGISGRIARNVLPVLLLLPFLREASRVRLLFVFHFPESAAAAALASAAATISVLLLVIICRKIAAMEAEIHDLSLRDELTGVLNLRGFRIMAEQAIRLARRAEAPFSILFVDLDHLKKINDGLGHDIGSAFLVETARLLKSSFRDTDIIARIGGDEFAVAGQFSAEEIAAAAERLESASLGYAEDMSLRMPISLSIGYATCAVPNTMEIEELLQDADLAMYEQKRTRRQKEQSIVGETV